MKWRKGIKKNCEFPHPRIAHREGPEQKRKIQPVLWRRGTWKKLVTFSCFEVSIW